MKTQDLTLVPTELLPPQYAHVRFPAREYGRYRAMVQSGEITPVGSLQRRGGTIYTTVIRHAPQHRAPGRLELMKSTPVKVAVPVVVILALLSGAVALVRWAVLSTVQALPGVPTLLGFLVAISLALLGLAAIRRPRSITGTFRGTIR